MNREVICTLVDGDVTAVSVAVNQRVLGPASLIRANTATSDHLLHISGQIDAKYHLQTSTKSPRAHTASSSRTSRIRLGEKSMFDAVSLTLVSAGSCQETRGAKDAQRDRSEAVHVRGSNPAFDKKSYLVVFTI